MKEPIHETVAAKKNKAELLELIYGKDQWQHFNTKIPQKFWNRFHAPTHVIDNRTNEIINLVDEGIKRGLIYKTVKH